MFALLQRAIHLTLKLAIPSSQTQLRKDPPALNIEQSLETAQAGSQEVEVPLLDEMLLPCICLNDLSVHYTRNACGHESKPRTPSEHPNPH